MNKYTVCGNVKYSEGKVKYTCIIEASKPEKAVDLYKILVKKKFTGYRTCNKITYKEYKDGDTEYVEPVIENLPKSNSGVLNIDEIPSYLESVLDKFKDTTILEVVYRTKTEMCEPLMDVSEYINSKENQEEFVKIGKKSLILSVKNSYQACELVFQLIIAEVIGDDSLYFVLYEDESGVGWDQIIADNEQRAKTVYKHLHLDTEDVGIPNLVSDVESSKGKFTVIPIDKNVVSIHSIIKCVLMKSAYEEKVNDLIQSLKHTQSAYKNYIENKSKEMCDTLSLYIPKYNAQKRVNALLKVLQII